VTGDAGLENFLAPSGGIRFAQSASGKKQSADQEKQDPNRELMWNELLTFAHVQPQGPSQGADTSSRQNRTQAELALNAALSSAI